ncbi:MAG TPA: hypothetical protein DIS68_08260 [Lachnospiraceae bacterium]|nr:hypothetical protein [Lachnospiraceae bacterium]HBB58714.1 hypothetical protein [Lachnospiraceae bacterium]HCS00780.1 hypothetical protein [Lachnospiraceae bacterium]
MKITWKWMPYILTVLCTAVYVSLVFNNNLWLDEAFSASIIRCGFREMISRTASDTLPPFYNVAAWCFTRIFGYSPVSLKLFSVLPMVLLMLVSSSFLSKAASPGVAGIYILLVTSMPYMLEHGVEIRMYSWALFFASASAIFAMCYMKDIRGSLPCLVICTVLGAYTHQYALITEVYIWLMLLVFFVRRKQILTWVKPAVLCIALYIPCGILTIFQLGAATSYFSASAPSAANFLSSLRYPFVTHYTVWSALLLAAVALLFVAALADKDSIAAYYISIFALETVMSYGVMAVTGSTFFSSRYLMPAIGIMWLGTAIAVSDIPFDRMPSFARIGIYAVLTWLVIITLILVYSRQHDEEYTDTSAFEEFIDSTDADDGYVICEDFPEIQVCLVYYAPWLTAYTLDDIDSVKGDRYLLVNENSKSAGEVHPEEKIDLKYLGTYSFDRYTFKAYAMQ